MRALLLSAGFIIGTAGPGFAITLLDETLTADASATAPSFASAALSCAVCSQGGGLLSGPVSFSAPSAGVLTIGVRDLGRVGDVFEVLLDDVSKGTTSPVSIDGPTSSAGTFTSFIGAGFHSIDIWDVTLAYAGAGVDTPFDGLVPFDFMSTDLRLTATLNLPEPGTLTLLGAALAVAALTVRFRRST